MIDYRGSELALSSHCRVYEERDFEGLAHGFPVPSTVLSVYITPNTWGFGLLLFSNICYLPYRIELFFLGGGGAPPLVLGNQSY